MACKLNASPITDVCCTVITWRTPTCNILTGITKLQMRSTKSIFSIFSITLGAYLSTVIFVSLSLIMFMSFTK